MGAEWRAWISIHWASPQDGVRGNLVGILDLLPHLTLTRPPYHSPLAEVCWNLVENWAFHLQWTVTRPPPQCRVSESRVARGNKVLLLLRPGLVPVRPSEEPEPRLHPEEWRSSPQSPGFTEPNAESGQLALGKNKTAQPSHGKCQRMPAKTQDLNKTHSLIIPQMSIFNKRYHSLHHEPETSPLEWQKITNRCQHGDDTNV